MAEAAVSFVIERLGDLLIQKVVFLKGVRGQVERLQDQLVRMKCFLKDADEKQDDDARIRNWVSEIRLAAYDAEDVIETFIIRVESLKKKGLFLKLTFFPKRIFRLYKVGKDIESIQARIEDIAKSHETFGIRNLGEGTSSRGEELQRLRRSSPLIEDKDIVGLEDKTNLLVEQLLKEDRCFRVVSIIGMGGVGKTTLARKVYNHADMRAQFDCRAWVCVSQNYNHKDILGSIIKQVKKPTNELLEMLEKMQEQDLEQMLHQELENKSYLVVLDDIWKEEDLDCLARAFPTGGHASRLLVTSRNQDVPLRADSRSNPYELKTLGQEDSWLLFLRKALSDSGNPICPSDLESTGREIARRCSGLPLAITVIGGLLARKKKLKSEWERVLNSISTHLSRTENGVSSILALSYADLPPHLKSCFLYFGIFPEDYEISVHKLFHLWIAEGLIQQRGTENLEDIAIDNLEELINRNMIEVAAVSADERAKSCRIHDLLRELSIAKAKEEIFLDIHGVRYIEPLMKTRHLSIHCQTDSYTYSARSTPHLRSLFFFKLAPVTTISLDFSSFKLLKSLDLENMGFTNFPEEVGEVSLLRYLGLRNTKIRKLPESLGRLQNLEILDIYLDNYIDVPNVIWKLRNMRHLYMNNTRFTVPLKVEMLSNLRTLCFIHFDNLVHSNLQMLISLQKLGLVVNSHSNMDELCNSIGKLGKLISLSLRRDNEFPPLNGLSRLIHLTKLKLLGGLEKLPSLHDFPPNLSHLNLSGTSLDDDPMPILEKLENLSILKLKMAYLGRTVVISDNGFPKLKFLGLSDFDGLEEIKVGKGALSGLKFLRVIRNYNLKMLPEELQNITSLEKVEILEMRKRFIARLQGEDSYKIWHVPTLILKEVPDGHVMRVKLTVQAAALQFIAALENQKN